MQKKKKKYIKWCYSLFNNVISHIFTLIWSLNYRPRNIGGIHCYLDEDTCNHALGSLVISQIDYCNSLLYDLTAKDMQKLQKIQNRAARLVFKANCREHTTPLLRELNWLPVCGRIKFKLHCTNTCIHVQKQPWNNSTLHTKPPKTSQLFWG